jgi:hypothetical protein
MPIAPSAASWIFSRQATARGTSAVASFEEGTMRTMTFACVCIAFGLATVPAGSTRAAQRTFVASNGSDANACSITAPCRGFARALTQTNAGGEIVVLDSAGYGAFTIDRSVSVIAPPGVYAGVSVFAPFAGITVDAPGAKVALRGLSINGQGGTPGIWMKTGAELQVEGCVVSGLVDGITIESGSTSVKDTIIRDNSSFGARVENGAVSVHFDHVRAQNNGSVGIRVSLDSASARVSIRNATVTDNGGHGISILAYGTALNVVDIDSTEVGSNGWASIDSGIFVYAYDATAKAEVSVANALVARNRGEGVFAYPVGGVAHVSVTGSTITGNYGRGIANSGAGGTVIASGNTVTRNGMAGLANDSGTFYSTRDNRVQGNFGLGNTSGVITTLSGL